MTRQLTVQDINKILESPGAFTGLLEHMAHGEPELDYCKKVGVSFADMQDFIRKDKERLSLYQHATVLYEQWFVIRIMQELKLIGLMDIKEAFNPNGTLKAIEDIPEAIRRTIGGIEIQETFENDDSEPSGKRWTGYLKKIKFIDKIKSLELLGKKLNMFADKIQVSGSVELRHTVDQFDLDERLKMLRMPRTTIPTTQQAQTILDVQSENNMKFKNDDNVMEDAVIVEKPWIPPVVPWAKPLEQASTAQQSAPAEKLLPSEQRGGTDI